MNIFECADHKRQGEWAEVCFVAEAMRRGLVVSKPYGDSSRYDFLVDAGGTVSRVQVKSVSLAHENAYRISIGRGMESKHSYSPDEVDFIAAYVIPSDTWYIIPVSKIYPRKTVHVYPHRPSEGRLEQYKQAWELLRKCDRHQDGRRSARPALRRALCCD